MVLFKFHLIGSSDLPVLDVEADDLRAFNKTVSRNRFIERHMTEPDSDVGLDSCLADQYAGRHTEGTIMTLTEEEIADILQASAHSRRPLSDDTIIRIAEECGHDPDMLVLRAKDFREDAIKNQEDDGEPMGFIL